MKVSIPEIRKELQCLNKTFGKDYEIYEIKGGMKSIYGIRYARDIRITATDKADLELLKKLPHFIKWIARSAEIYREAYDSDRYMIRVSN